MEPLSSSIIGSLARPPLLTTVAFAAAFCAAASASISGGGGRPIVVGRPGWNNGAIGGTDGAPVDGARGPTEGRRPELGAPGGIEFGLVGSGT